MSSRPTRTLFDVAYGNRTFIVAITLIVAMLFFWLGARVEREFSNAQRAQFEFRLSELHSAVLLMQSSLVAKNVLEQGFVYEGANPMDWLMPDLAHYYGEMSMATAEIASGGWIFDPEQKVVAYWSTLNKSEGEWLRFQVRVLRSKSDEVKGLVLESL